MIDEFFNNGKYHAPLLSKYDKYIKNENKKILSYLKCGDKKCIQEKQLKNFTENNVHKLDLHYYLMDHAFQKFSHFIAYNFEKKNRFLLIITGKNINENSITINSQVEKWINRDDLRPMILFFDYEKNNQGCFQMILKKNR